MDTTQLEAKEQELNKKEQKLKQYAEILKNKKEELEKAKTNYKQELEDKINAEFNDRVNKGIEKQRQSIEKRAK